MEIIKAKNQHFKEIIQIYNWAIENTTSTFDTQLKTLEDFSPFLTSFKINPLLVIVDDQKSILGWGCLKPYSDMKAYSETYEISLYIKEKNQGKGLGSLLMDALLQKANELSIHTIISRVTTESSASIKLHEKFNFKTIGIMKEVGYKFGRRCDVAWMQLLLNNK